MGEVPPHFSNKWGEGAESLVCVASLLHLVGRQCFSCGCCMFDNTHLRTNSLALSPQCVSRQSSSCGCGMFDIHLGANSFAQSLQDALVIMLVSRACVTVSRSSVVKAPACSQAQCTVFCFGTRTPLKFGHSIWMRNKKQQQPKSQMSKYT